MTEIEVFEKREETEQILGTPGERDSIGDVAMLQGTSALANARVKSEEAEVLQVPAVELRRAGGAARSGRADRERLYHASAAAPA